MEEGTMSRLAGMVNEPIPTTASATHWARLDTLTRIAARQVGSARMTETAKGATEHA